ncbi:Dual specificity phosphatase, catalytic domain family protein [Aspergillus niger]|uniref:Dual specificity phosphatase, catalytic domain family protein n=1 Tax=Aspergillus niger TaxID=5061 RepID=A0A505HR28_ASPNG|nr:Dual specificity phosphatase, catalytic domain family protein [Aspergillus niger]
MTLTDYASYPDSPDLAALNLSRLVARLEHNLLSSAADLKPLRRSEYQRMRVGANIEYARTNLQTLERTLPQIKPTDRRNDLQTDLARQRQILKQLQIVLDEISSSQAEPQSDEEEEDDSLDGEDLLDTPEEGSTTDEQFEHEEKEQATPAPTQEQPSTLRNRSHAPTTTPSTATASATGSSIQKNPPSPQQSSDASSDARLQATEETLSSHRAEQENLTSSMLALATQLKTSAQTFHSSLEAEKSVLARAVDGIDRTAGNMKVAEQRMGMLRRMTEGKGWWGRMMLYAWIFGMWVVAILIVFLGPKLRF